MSLTVACTCGQHYNVDEQYAGQQVPCSVCGQLIYIPHPAYTAAPPPPPPPPEPPPPPPPPKVVTAIGPFEAEPFEDEPAPRAGGSGPLIALVATLLIVFVIGGGLAGTVWWMSRQKGEKQANNDDTQKKEQFSEVVKHWPPVNDNDDTRKDKDKSPPIDKDRDKKEEKDKAQQKEDDKDKVKQVGKAPPPTGEPWKGHEASILAVAIDRSGKHVWTASGNPEDNADAVADSTLRRWDATTGKEIDRLELNEQGVAAAAFDTDCKRAAVALPGRSAIELWDLTTKKKIATLDEHRKPVRALAFSADGRRLVSGGEDRLLIAWDLGTNKPLNTYVGHTKTIDAVAISHDGRMAVSGSRDHSAKLWDLSKGDQGRDLSGHGDIVWAAAFSPDGSLALTGGGLHQSDTQPNTPSIFTAGTKDYEVRYWDASQAKEKSRGKPLDVAVRALAFSPDSRRFLAGGDDGSLRLWQMGANKEVKNLKGHSARVRGVAFFPEGRKAVSVSDDRSIRLWDLPADLPELVRDLKGNDAAARSAALEELKRLGADAKPVIADLFVALTLGDNAWKGEVIELLKTFSPLEAQHVPRLDVLLQDRKFIAGRLYAVDELAKMGESARPAAKTLLAAVADEDLQVRRGAVTALTPIIDEVGSKAFVPLVGALRDKDASLRAAAEKALEKLGRPGIEHLRVLQKMLSEEGVSVKRFAVKALGEMGDGAAESVTAVARLAVEDRDADVRKQAFESLGKIAPTDERTVVAASKGLEDRSAGVYRQAAKTLAGTRDVPALLAALEHEDDEVGKTADEALKKVRFAKKHLDVLSKLLESKRELARNRAIEALGDLGADAAGAVPALSRSLKDAGQEERARILALLVKMGKAAKPAGKEVAKLLKTKDKVQQLEVSRVLIKIEAPEVEQAVPALIDQMKPTAGDFNDDDAKAHREKARQTLVEVGKPAVARILEAIEGKYAGGRGDDLILNALARLALVKTLSDMGPVAAGTETLRVLAKLRKLENELSKDVRDEALKAYQEVQRKKE